MTTVCGQGERAYPEASSHAHTQIGLPCIQYRQGIMEVAHVHTCRLLKVPGIKKCI